MKKMPVLTQSILFNFFIVFAALVLTWIFGGPKIDIEPRNAQLVSSVLIIGFLAIIVFCAANRRRNRGLKKNNFHELIRYPEYSAVVFLLNPALAIIFRSWLLVLAVIPAYFIWRDAAKSNDVSLSREHGDKHRQYRMSTPMLFPKITNKYLLFALIGALVFIIIFIALNYFSLYLRYVKWDEKQTSGEKIFIVKPEKSPATGKIKLYNEPNGAIIGKLGVRAPLIFAQSDKQKELDTDLDKGIVAYPGSVSPGEIGNLFITGHSSAFPWSKTQYGQVFAKLDKLEKGDRVVIFYNQRKFEYEIENKYLISPKDLKLVHPDNYSKITLSTCWPIGTDLKRLVVEGRLVQ